MEALPGVEVRSATPQKRRSLRSRGPCATIERKPEPGAEPDDDGNEDDVEDLPFLGSFWCEQNALIG